MCGSDVFAAGLIFYELLTGDLPFKANSTVERLLQRTRERARPPELVDPAIPKRLSQIVMGCLEMDSVNRYQTAYEILCDLDGGESKEEPEPARRSAPAWHMLGTRYRIEAEAGEGGMGKVYKATDLDLGRTVALKVVRSELSSDPQSFEQLKREILLAECGGIGTYCESTILAKPTGCGSYLWPGWTAKIWGRSSGAMAR